MKNPTYTHSASRALLCAVGLAMAAAPLSADVAVILGPDRLDVKAPPSHAGDRLTLVWDAKDKGDDIAAWAHSYEIDDAVPSDGETYALVPSELGIAEGQVCRILTLQTHTLLEKVGAFASGQAYVETAYKDTDCHGVEFGFYSTVKSKDWGGFLGTKEGSSPNYGFVMSLNGSSNDSWFWTCPGTRAGATAGAPRPPVLTDRFNVVTFKDGTFTLNGTVVSSGRTTSPVGKQGLLMRIGRNHDSRYQDGWWSHVRLLGSDGKALLDYLPVKSADGKVGFFDRVTSTCVYSSGSGSFTAGTATNTLSVVHTSQSFTATGIATIGITFSGSRMVANVPAHCVGDRLLLLWDDADKGSDIGAWAHAYELAAAVRKGGGSHVVDLGRIGVRNGQTCAVVAIQQYEPLDMLKMADFKTVYVDTGVRDSVCYGVQFGFCGNESPVSWGTIIGSQEGPNPATATSSGFAVSMSNAAYDSWFWYYRNLRSPTRPAVKTDSINDVSFADGTFAINGSPAWDGTLPDGPVAETGKNIFVGTTAQYCKSRAVYGWWSYVKLQAFDGEDLVDYIPVKRTSDGAACFYDRVTKRFVESTGGGAFTAGSVTGAVQSVVQTRTVAAAPYAMDALDVTVQGAKIVVKAPASFVQQQLLLLWDETDKGDALDEWEHRLVLVEAVPATGGTYEADWEELGIDEVPVCRAVAVHRLQLLDMLKMPTTSTYIDTGIKDTECYGVCFGFYGTESNDSSWGYFIGSKESGGFCLGSPNNGNTWSFSYGSNGKYQPRPTVKTDSINTVSFENAVFTLNGSKVVPTWPTTSLPSGSVGTSGIEISIGRNKSDKRYLYGWWSYVKLQDAAAANIVDYIPAKRISDDAVGFYDRASAQFVLSTGGGAFTAGTVTNADYTAIRDRASVSLSNAVVTAVWTGEGAAGRLDDPANWNCTNPFGEQVAGVPDANTAVTFPSADAFNCPAGTAFKCRSITLNGALTADRDWRGIDFAAVGGAFDLCGHALSVVAYGDLEKSCAVSDTVGGGELRVGVPVGARVANSSVSLSGRLALVKDGAGAFVAAKKGQTYAGGTDVAEGTFACGGKGSEGVYGTAEGTVTVRTGATFDCNGCNGHAAAKLVLDGGTVANTVGMPSPFDYDWFADVTLTADSFVRADKTFCISRLQNAPTALETNGHKLTLDIDGNFWFGMVNTTVTGGGTIHQRTGGFLRLDGVTAETTALDVEHSLAVYSDSVFKDYISRYGGGWDKGAGKIKVLGRFCPDGVGMAFHSAELQDGAVLDLSKVTTPWNAYCKNANFEYEQTLTFADNATVTVAVGDRQPALNDQLVAWKAKPNGVNFVWDLPLPLFAKARGLFVMRQGMAIFIR